MAAAKPQAQRAPAAKDNRISELDRAGKTSTPSSSYLARMFLRPYPARRKGAPMPRDAPSSVSRARPARGGCSRPNRTTGMGIRNSPRLRFRRRPFFRSRGPRFQHARAPVRQKEPTSSTSARIDATHGSLTPVSADYESRACAGLSRGRSPGPARSRIDTDQGAKCRGLGIGQGPPSISTTYGVLQRDPPTYRAWSRSAAVSVEVVIWHNREDGYEWLASTSWRPSAFFERSLDISGTRGIPRERTWLDTRQSLTARPRRVHSTADRALCRAARIPPPR